MQELWCDSEGQDGIKMQKRVVCDIATEVHPCCIEYLPPNFGGYSALSVHPSDADEEPARLFVCGEYELQEELQRRVGYLKVYDSRDGSVLTSVECNSGILDMKVIGDHMGVVMSTGRLSLFGLADGALMEQDSVGRDEEGFFLSLSASKRVGEDDGEHDRKVAVSTEKSSLIIFDKKSTGLQESTAISNAHILCGESVPAWMVLFNPYDSNMLLSGGDDNIARRWDIRVDNSTMASATGILRIHDCGVTSACWSPTSEHEFAVGSYDATMSIWDARMLKKPTRREDTGWRIANRFQCSSSSSRT
jgi:WD40 repeat protein